MLLQEEIKITSVDIFVNPYTEPDEEEEEEEKTKDEKTREDEENEKVGSWYSNPGSGTTTAGGVGGGGVGKYLKARTAEAHTEVTDNTISNIVVAKKRKVGASSELKNFSS
ncbi:Peptidyl-prolyl cis-trans isomerase CYP65-like protein [Drosera capensis]